MNPVISMDQAKIFIDGTMSEPRLSHPEGLAFDKEGNLWCGGERGEIYRIDPNGQSLEIVANTGGFSLGMAFDRQDLLYVCDNKHNAVFRLNIRTNELTRFIDGAKEGIRVPNFPVIDHQRNCLYVSDSYEFGGKGPGVWRFDLTTGEGGLWFKEAMNFANGMVLSLDGNVLYVAETFGKQISAISIMEDGSAGGKQFVASIDALPDGLSVDQVGNIYVSCYEPSMLYRIKREGEVEVLIHDQDAHTLCHPTNCAFWEDELYTTNLGRWHITKFKVGIKGASLL
ncbi:SMP-30/gluconolactonase/LRE family protein [Ammoniphilus resinae]|uniref:Sugar lactone lactonase YvrE n=1 Tax=Ammoniphilus resinae TaxID=861532 RepID=A0ABS4GX71_9BACL|nr:SMP-30/gluconolactonase/LRE family protein [Ammoniphilus resinae]MBP1934465.1 sugar lactone lactonase YvrE [Ammoniphilus resinae]